MTPDDEGQVEPPEPDRLDGSLYGAPEPAADAETEPTIGDAADEFVKAQQRRRRTRSDSDAVQQAQSTLLDTILEDGELEEMLAGYVESEPTEAEKEKASKHRRLNKAIKDRMKGAHPEAINAGKDGVHSDWTICGQYRFRTTMEVIPGQEKKITFGDKDSWDDWEIERVGTLGI